MTPASTAASPARRTALLRLLGKTIANEAGMPPRERAQADRIYRGTLRLRGLCDALARRHVEFDPRRTPRPVQWILRLAIFEKLCQDASPDYAIGQQAVALAREFAGAQPARFVNAAMRRLMPALPESADALRALPLWAELPQTARLSCPTTIIRLYKEAYGADAPAVLDAMTWREAPVSLRVNLLRIDREGLQRRLADEGVTTEPIEGLPEALLHSGGEATPWATPAFAEGLFTIQDPAAMVATRLLDPRPGERIADLCAAPGGKTGHLWERMQGRGTLVACEIDPGRRGLLRETLGRMHGPDAPIDLPDASDLATALASRNFDAVMLDAPCQGFGLLRRYPETRWDDRLRRQAEALERQKTILRLGAAPVAPGGRLLWVTCSPTRAENESVLSDFMERSDGWSYIDPEPRLKALGLPWLTASGPIIRSRPDIAPVDGFAYALLERV